MLQNMSQRQKKLLLKLLEGEHALICIRGELYLVTPEAEGHSVEELASAEEYLVVGGQCTCPDSKYRGRECKHAAALRVFTR